MGKFARVLAMKSIKELGQELRDIAVDPAGVSIMSQKGIHYVVKVKNVPVVAANIIKQDMLARGGEVATAKGAITHAIAETDIIVMGTQNQFTSLLEKIKRQQFGLRDIAEQIRGALQGYDGVPSPLKVGKQEWVFGKKTFIMGILNMTPDSFSDGGKFSDTPSALSHARQMVEDGADIIDVGGESTRPGAADVSSEEEIARVVPVIQELKNLRYSLSIDTRKAAVAEAALKAGAVMINDISALRADPEMAKVAAKYQVPVVLMHMQGSPQTMQRDPRYRDLISEIMEYLWESIEAAKRAGIAERDIIIDPGIGFGKSTEHNLKLLDNLREFKSLGRAIMVGPSRKSFIGNITGLPVEERVEGTAAAVALAIANGADIVRVHDAAAMSRVARIADGISKKIENRWTNNLAFATIPRR